MLLGEEGNSLVLLLAINAIVFGMFNIIKVAYNLGDFGPKENYVTHVLNWFLVPGELKALAYRPWSVLTYMFVHEGAGLAGVMPLISNMLWFWSFGYILQDLTGNRHIAPLYLYGGIAGSIFFILAVNIIPGLGNNLAAIVPMQGAGASIMAVAIATTVLAPGFRIFPFINGGIPLWVLTLIFVAIDFTLVASNNGGVAVAHVAGGLFGMVYVGRLKAGKDWGLWMHQVYNWFFTLFDPAKNQTLPVAEIRTELFYQQGKQPPYRKKTVVTQQRIDDILDKINQHGYQLLSEEEKEYLKTASKEVD